jgi:hypothetical protein
LRGSAGRLKLALRFKPPKLEERCGWVRVKFVATEDMLEYGVALEVAEAVSLSFAAEL